MADRLTFRDLQTGSKPIWLLTVYFAGRAWRFATKPIQIDTADGETYTFEGGLGMNSFRQSIDLINASPPSDSYSFDLLFPANVAALVAQGHDLARATGEVAMWVDHAGLKWHQRMILVEGILTKPVYGTSDDPVSFTVERYPWHDRSQLLPSTMKISSTTWGDAHPDNMGIYYPNVFGSPGARVPISSGASVGTTEIGATPGLTCQFIGGNVTKILVAGHPVPSGTNVVISDGSATINKVVTIETDGAGNTVTTVNMVSHGLDQLKEYWVSWADSSGNASETYQIDDNSTIEGAGDLVWWLLTRTTIPVDLGRVAAVRARLNTYRLAGFIDAPVSAWEYLSNTVLPLLPVSVAVSATGVYPYFWDLDIRAADAVEALEEGRNAYRTGQVEYQTDSADLVSTIRLEYAYNGNTNTTERTRSATTTTKRDNVGVRVHGEHVSHYAVRSGLAGTTGEETTESVIVYDGATADQILAWKIRLGSQSPRTIAYQCSTVLSWLEPGSIVTLTDEDLSITDQVCTILSMTWTTSNTLELLLCIIPEPVRDSRATG